jgi:TRAP-type C4-dicarboxylate transport system permease small subunit
VGILRKLNHYATNLLQWTVVVMVIVMTLTLGAQVLLRYVFNITLPWTEELSLGLFTWTTLLTAALGVREGFHVRMSLLIETLPPGVRRQAERIIHLATCALGLFLTYAAWHYVADTRGSTSAAIGYPIEWLYFSGVVCGVLITLFALEAAWLAQIPSDEMPSECH